MNKIPKIFLITGIQIRPLDSYHSSYVEYKLRFYNNDYKAPVLDKRTFGWSPTYEEAEKWVLENASDIAEGGTFHWSVIEGFTPGIYIYKPDPQVFFEFIGDWKTDGHYEKINEFPKPINDYCEKHYLVKSFSSIG